MTTELIKQYRSWTEMKVAHKLESMGVDTTSDRGAVSTEMAIVIAGMVAVAIAATAIFLSKAESNANNIPG